MTSRGPSRTVARISARYLAGLQCHGPNSRPGARPFTHRTTHASTLEPSTTVDSPIVDEDIDAFFEIEDLWAVIVWNDDVTTFQTVIQAFVEIFGHTVERADQLAWKIHRTGQGRGGGAAQGRGRSRRPRAAPAQDLGLPQPGLIPPRGSRSRPSRACAAPRTPPEPRSARLALGQPCRQARLHVRPLRRHDGEAGRGAHRVVGPGPVRPHDAVELAADALDGGPRPLVAHVGLQRHPVDLPHLEGVRIISSLASVLTGVRWAEPASQVKPMSTTSGTPCRWWLAPGGHCQ